LIEGGRGVFTVIAEGREVWNKHRTGKFPNEDSLAGELASA
jgi:predicted Rdx family selenoprotein